MTERASGTTDDRAVAPESQPPESHPPEPVTDDTPPVKGLHRRRGLSSLLASAWLAWAVAAVALAFAVFAGIQWADAREQAAQLQEAERTRTVVADQARTVALRLTTFEGENIEDWHAQMRAAATDQFAEQLSQVFDQQTRDSLRRIGVVSVGEIENLFVQDIDGDEARVFALVKQTYVNASTPDPVEDHQRMDIRLQRVDGQWLASEVMVLGPNGVVAPTDEQQVVPDREQQGQDQ